MNSSAEDSQIYTPDKLSLAWLLKHMSISSWLLFFGILFGTFILGAKVGQTDFYHQLIGKEINSIEDAGAVSLAIQRNERNDAVAIKASNEISLFPEKVPLPDELENFPPGTKVSLLLTAFPEPIGELSTGWYSISINSEIYKKVLYIFNGDDKDPVIRDIVLLFINKDAYLSTLNKIIASYGAEGSISI